MVYAQPSVCLGKWNAKTPLGFWDTNGSPNLSQSTRPNYNQQRERKRERERAREREREREREKTSRILDSAVPSDHSKSERKGKEG